MMTVKPIYLSENRNFRKILSIIEKFMCFSRIGDKGNNSRTLFFTWETTHVQLAVSFTTLHFLYYIFYTTFAREHLL